MNFFQRSPRHPTGSIALPWAVRLFALDAAAHAVAGFVWVLGEPLARDGSKTSCPSCGGSGACRYCGTPALPEVVVPEQAETVEDVALPPVEAEDRPLPRDLEPPPSLSGEPDGSPV
jgi:hypothetical protein